MPRPSRPSKSTPASRQRRMNAVTGKRQLPSGPWALRIGRFALWWHHHPWLRVFLAVGVFSVVLGLIALLGVWLYFCQIAKRYDLAEVSRMPMESRVLDARGQLLGSLHGDGRSIVPLEAVSPWFLKALVAREDSRFYDHDGVDWIGVIRASLRNSMRGEIVEGAGTISMQLARNTFDLRAKSLKRKLLEAALSKRIEEAFSKDEILRLYINRIFYGTGLHGVEQAARGYYGKPASEMTLAESAMLVGIIRAPNRFSPFRHYEAALAEQRDVIGRMEVEGVIDASLAATAKEDRPEVLPESSLGSRVDRGGPRLERDYPLEAVERELALLLPQEELDKGGLEISTTFDLVLQRAAAHAVETRLAEIEQEPGYAHPLARSWQPAAEGEPEATTDYLQAAVTVIEQASGEIRVLIGGRNFAQSRFDRARQARRQVGSVIKPLIYAAAFEQGLFPGTYVSDDPLKPGEIPWAKQKWSPKNSDGRFLGAQPASKGLIESRNTMTVRVGERAGFGAVSALIAQAGLIPEEEVPVSPQTYIGNLGATLESLTSAYTAFPGAGFRHEPYFIARITRSDGGVLYEHADQTRELVSPGAAWLTSRLLEQVTGPKGTARGLAELGFTAPAAGKTGTTDDFHDAWFLGYTSRLTAGVWVGLDRPGRIVNRGYGSRVALPVWADVMAAAQQIGYECGALPVADDIMDVELCRDTGALATEGCHKADRSYRERVPHAMIPREFCSRHAPGVTSGGGAGGTGAEEPGLWRRFGKALGFGD